MYEMSPTAKRLLRFGAVCVLAALLCSPCMARAAEVTPRTVIPVGHTVGIKLFARGVMVVKLPEESGKQIAATQENAPEQAKKKGLFQGNSKISRCNKY